MSGVGFGWPQALAFRDNPFRQSMTTYQRKNNFGVRANSIDEC